MKISAVMAKTWRKGVLAALVLGITLLSGLITTPVLATSSPVLLADEEDSGRVTGGFSGGVGAGTTEGSEAAEGGASAGTSGSGGGGTCGGNAFLGFVPWYDGLICDANGAISSKNFDGSDSAQSIATFVWKIALNVLSDISLAVGYVALAMVIYSGFLILTAQGEAERLAKGRKTLVATGVGAAIAILATIAIRLIIGVLS